ncbi:MAG: 30S ribosomal protein S2 [Bacteroidota bacterium]
MAHYVEIEQLLEAGSHFGHLTRRWNPKMEKFIFGERNGIHIIDLRKTQILLDIARNVAFDAASKGKTVMFIGTKQQAKTTIEEQAKRCGVNYVCERWLGGMLTNFSTIRKSIKRLITIDKMEVDGTFEKITKKERLLLSRERDRLRKVFGGIEEMTRLPGALFVVDIKKEHIAVKEAKILDIPVIALVDTNCDPETVDFPIPANDDSIRTVELVSRVLADAVIEGNSLFKTRAADQASDSDRMAKESDSTSDDQAKVQRRFRERRSAKPGDGGNRGDNRGGDRGGRPQRSRNDRPNDAPKDQAPKPENN